MKKIALLAFVLVLFLTAVVLGFVGIVVAGETIRIKADGSVDPATAPISNAGNVTYTFTGNINDHIVIERNNIVVDGAGYTLQGTGTLLEKGIYLFGRSNVTIKNMKIKSFSFGIYLNSSSNNIITGNNITNNWFGVYLLGSSNNKFYHNNLIDNNFQAGVTTGDVNTWDNGYPSGGNYWSDYKERYLDAEEIDESGIWNTPYDIYPNNKDNYPLMNPWGNSPPSYTLTIDSSPIHGVTFTVDGVSNTTPWSKIYGKRESVDLVMPETHKIGDAKYNWTQWSDGNTIRSRTVIITKNITLTANYTGPYYGLTVTSSPITGINFTINGNPKTTIYTGWLLEGSYTIEMPETHDGYVWFQWQDLDPNRIKTVTMDKNISLTAVFTPPDITSPTISILSPENKTYLVEYVLLNFNVSEPTSWIGYSLDGQMNATISGNITLVGLSDGTHTITVYANDTAGNMGHSNTVHFTIDTESPEIEIISPENKTYQVDNVPLTFNVDEPTSWIGYSLDGQMNVTISGNTTLVGLSDGTHTITVYANDTDGNIGHSKKVYFTIDTGPPNIEILSPENRTYTVTDVLLTFNVSEPTSWIGYSLDGQMNVTISGNTTLVGLSDGTHTITVYANDTAGNMGSSGIVHFTMATPPSISIFSPQNKTYDTTDIPLTFTVDETVSWMAYSLDGQANLTITGNIVLSGLSEGSHNIIVYAKDTAGNTGASGIVYFTIETRQAEPSQLWIVVVIAIIAGVGLAVAGYMAYDLLKKPTISEPRNNVKED